MKNFKPTLLQFSLLCVFFAVISCSKDSEDTPETSEVTVTTSNFLATIDENPSEAQLIGTVVGTTNQGSVAFSITEQTPAGAFSINTTTGELKVANEALFDFETNPTISGTVKVANGAVSENASVTISMNDVTEDNVYNGSVLLMSQQEINDFGANNYTHIVGSLFIGDYNYPSAINDLTPLQTLQSVGLVFQIYKNGELTSLAGLENIETAGYLEISQNSALIDISALSNITEIANHLMIEENDLINNINSLSNLIFLGGELHILENPILDNLCGIENLIVNGVHLGSLFTYGNAYNPTRQDIINGNCSL